MSERFVKTLLMLVLLISSVVFSPLYARSITDALGQTVEVPEQPQRVIALSELDLDAMLALQMPVLATTAGRGQTTVPAYLPKAAASIPLVGSFASPVLDRVIAYQPDLILAGGIPDADLLAKLSKIAPTVVTFKSGEPWTEAFARIALVLNRSEQAHQVLRAYQQRAHELGQRIGASQSISIVRWTAQGPVYMLDDAFSSRIIKDVGLQRPAAQRQPGAAHSSPLNLNAIAQIDGDWMFVGVFAQQGQAKKMMRQTLRQANVQSLHAVRQGHLHVVDAALWTSLGGPLAAQAILDDVQRFVVDGQPSAWSMSEVAADNPTRHTAWIRGLAAVLIGAALATAGMMMQSLTRNPLAEPGLLGIQAGASLAVVLGIVWLGIGSRAGLTLFAAMGALLGCWMVLMLARRHEAADTPLRLILAGVALSATLHGLMAGILLNQPSGLDQFRFWQLGSLAAIEPKHVYLTAPMMLVALALSVWTCRPLALLMLGDETAQSLGQNPQRLRVGLIVLIAFLSGGAVSLAGPIVFLGLVAPFIARRLLSHRSLMIQMLAAMLLGSVILLLADVLAQRVAYPFETPVSVVLAFVGAPVMVLLARKGGSWLRI